MIPTKRAMKWCILSGLACALIASALTSALITRVGPLGKLAALIDLAESKFYTEVDRDRIFDGAARGAISGLGDPYSVYMDPKEWTNFRINSSGEYSGVGITIGVRDGKVQVISPIKGSPAEKAGLRTNDVILKVDGKPVTNSEDAATLIRGPAGTSVVLTIGRDGQVFDVSLVRAQIMVPAASYEMLAGDIGYIELMNFNEHSFAETQAALRDLIAQGAKGIILDLRNNGGGYVDECVAIAGLFIREGETVVTIEGRSVPTEVVKSKGPGTNLPLVVLVNEGSASASEILAGAIQDLRIGTLVGTRTFGKGLVQSVYQLKDGSAAKITIAEYRTPSGRRIHGEGLEPDVKVDDPEEQMRRALEIIQAKLAG